MIVRFAFVVVLRRLEHSAAGLACVVSGADAEFGEVGREGVRLSGQGGEGGSDGLQVGFDVGGGGRSGVVGVPA
jgi:hypothetical protein